MVKTPLAEMRDQSLHFLMCFALAFFSLLGRPHLWAIPIALLISYGFGMVREWYQHNRLIWWSFDLSFCGLGAVVGSVIPFFIGTI